jgi:hypothetical protein
LELACLRPVGTSDRRFGEDVGVAKEERQEGQAQGWSGRSETSAERCSRTREATGRAVALVTASAGQLDIADLLLDLDGSPEAQALTGLALLMDVVAPTLADLADAWSCDLREACDEVLPAGQSAPATAALSRVHVLIDVLEGDAPPDQLGADVQGNVVPGPHLLLWLSALTVVTVGLVEARCDEYEEPVTEYLASIGLPNAAACHTDIDADVTEDYVMALLEARLESRKGLLTEVAAALSARPNELDDELLEEFDDLGGAERLAQLDGLRLDDLDPDDLRLVILALLDRIEVSPDGQTVSDRLAVSWRSYDAA